ncbi:unknown protein [Seminavis robusta]|uniref:Uncharacterized protein n=1 Tax=Seminavis robusta TaxID=568900 RepID=A0A9N8DQ64_9STRA|nr:unknown protein [Seminavis robusta]|eukprot:Sro268_g103720.1 n/a (555) ;mRNA; f:49345-51009
MAEAMKNDTTTINNMMNTPIENAANNNINKPNDAVAVLLATVVAMSMVKKGQQGRRSTSNDGRKELMFQPHHKNVHGDTALVGGAEYPLYETINTPAQVAARRLFKAVRPLKAATTVVKVTMFQPHHKNVDGDTVCVGGAEFPLYNTISTPAQVAARRLVKAVRPLKAATTVNDQENVVADQQQQQVKAVRPLKAAAATVVVETVEEDDDFEATADEKMTKTSSAMDAYGPGAMVLYIAPSVQQQQPQQAAAAQTVEEESKQAIIKTVEETDDDNNNKPAMDPVVIANNNNQSVVVETEEEDGNNNKPAMDPVIVANNNNQPNVVETEVEDDDNNKPAMDPVVVANNNNELIVDLDSMTDEELMNSMEPFSEYVQDFQTVPAKLKKAPTTKGKTKKKGQNRRGWGAWATRRWQQEGYGRQSKQRNVPGRNRKGRRVVFDEKVNCIVHHKPSAERKLTTRNCNTIYRKVDYHRGIVECAVKANGGELLNCFPGLKQAEWRKIRDEVAAARVDFMLYNLAALLWRVPLFLIGFVIGKRTFGEMFCKKLTPCIRRDT